MFGDTKSVNFVDMAGQPRKRAMILGLEQRTRAMFEDEPDATHLDYVVAVVEGGGTMVKIVRQIAEECGLELPDAMLGTYLHKTFADAGERLDRARQRGAHALAEETLEVADESVLTPADAARARNKIGALQWLAGAWNRPVFAPTAAAVQVNVSAGALHLDAMRTRAFISHAKQAAPANEAEQPAMLAAGQADAAGHATDRATVDAEVLEVQAP